MKSKSNIAVNHLENMAVENLRALAKAAGVPVGKSKKNTIANLLPAIDSGKLHCKCDVYFSTNPAQPGEPTQRKYLYHATERTYTSGPGQENVVHITPDAPLNMASASA